jgi:hypothetical protein
MISPRLRLYAIELIIHHFSCNWTSKQYNILLSNSRTTDTITLSYAITISSSAVGLSRVSWSLQHQMHTSWSETWSTSKVLRNLLGRWYKTMLSSTNSVFVFFTVFLFFTFQIEHSQWTLSQYYIFGTSDANEINVEQRIICFAKTKHNWHSKFNTYQDEHNICNCNDNTNNNVTNILPKD